MAANIVGLTFGYLTVVERAPNLATSKYAAWRVLCVCGVKTIRTTQQLRKTHGSLLLSCGCRKREMYADARGTHGWSSHHLYPVYKAMLRRCYEPSDKAYHRYGGRGIEVCVAWRTSFENFLRDMGTTFNPGLELDRRDNDGPYSAENCRWVDHRTQCNNKSRHVLIDTPKGRMTVAQAAPIFGLSGVELVSQTPLKRRSTT